MKINMKAVFFFVAVFHVLSICCMDRDLSPEEGILQVIKRLKEFSSGRTDVTRAEVVDVDSNGNTLLHLAAYYGYGRAACLLFKNGADLSLQNNEGDTPLHCALSDNVGRGLHTAIGLINLAVLKKLENQRELAQKRAETILYTFENLDLPWPEDVARHFFSHDPIDIFNKEMLQEVLLLPDAANKLREIPPLSHQELLGNEHFVSKMGGKERAEKEIAEDRFALAGEWLNIENHEGKKPLEGLSPDQWGHDYLPRLIGKVLAGLEKPTYC